MLHNVTSVCVTVVPEIFYIPVSALCMADTQGAYCMSRDTAGCYLEIMTDAAGAAQAGASLYIQALTHREHTEASTREWRVYD